MILTPIVTAIIGKVADRMKEPSSYSSIGVIALIALLNENQGLLDTITQSYKHMFVFTCLVLGVILSERKK